MDIISLAVNSVTVLELNNSRYRNSRKLYLASLESSYPPLYNDIKHYSKWPPFALIHAFQHWRNSSIAARRVWNGISFATLMIEHFNPSIVLCREAQETLSNSSPGNDLEGWGLDLWTAIPQLQWMQTTWYTK